ncbi:MAG: Hpt domain-containing protein, partial [Fretibacterium sp.]|nr:Hpt domain-containing protein [Fretibacterium sp.]
MTDMDMSQYLGAFLDETDDNLQRLDDLLLALEKNMVDMDVINEIFRAAHTLKGMAGTMGFTQMMGLTHAMEDRLDEARKETRPLTEADMNLLFTGLDSLQAMADSIRGGGNDAHIDVSAMVAALRHEGPAPEEAAAAPEPQKADASALSEKDIEWLQKANEMSMTPYSVHVTLSQSCLLKAARAYMVVNRLEEMGTLYKTNPASEALENEDFEWDFTVYLASSQPAEELKKAVEKISDIATAEVTEVKAGDAPAAPAAA